MIEELQLGDVSIDLVFKDIKNVHLNIHLPTDCILPAAP